MEERAEIFALKMHGDQKYGNKPYAYHLRAVVEVLRRFGHEDPTLIAAAWLHDVLEDTDVTSEELSREFGSAVVDCVERVTTEPGESRKERFRATYPKIRASAHALTVKLADRIANVEASKTDSADLLAMYKKEYQGFRSALRTPGELEEMWQHLDGLLDFMKCG